MATSLFGLAPGEQLGTLPPITPLTPLGATAPAQPTVQPSSPTSATASSSSDCWLKWPSALGGGCIVPNLSLGRLNAIFLGFILIGFVIFALLHRSETLRTVAKESLKGAIAA